jgi:hypothetical protein
MAFSGLSAQFPKYGEYLNHNTATGCVKDMAAKHHGEKLFEFVKTAIDSGSWKQNEQVQAIVEKAFAYVETHKVGHSYGPHCSKHSHKKHHGHHHKKTSHQTDDLANKFKKLNTIFTTQVQVFKGEKEAAKVKQLEQQRQAQEIAQLTADLNRAKELSLLEPQPIAFEAPLVLPAIETQKEPESKRSSQLEPQPAERSRAEQLSLDETHVHDEFDLQDKEPSFDEELDQPKEQRRPETAEIGIQTDPIEPEIREIIREVEVPVEVIREVIHEVEVVREVIREVEVPVEVQVPVEVVRTRIVRLPELATWENARESRLRSRGALTKPTQT